MGIFAKYYNGYILTDLIFQYFLIYKWGKWCNWRWVHFSQMLHFVPIEFKTSKQMRTTKLKFLNSFETFLSHSRASLSRDTNRIVDSATLLSKLGRHVAREIFTTLLDLLTATTVTMSVTILVATWTCIYIQRVPSIPNEPNAHQNVEVGATNRFQVQHGVLYQFLEVERTAYGANNQQHQKFGYVCNV